MMMKTNVQLLCDDLDQLLKDICDYLSTQTNDENMTENQRLFANKLIQRSKKQLQQISKVSVALSTDVDDQSYVDMNKQSAVELEEVTYDETEDNEYTPIECPSMKSTVQPCPYASLPAIELEKCEKFGHIDRKGRFLFIGHQKRLFAGIKGNWLLLYATKKDNKPLENLNLINFSAKPADSSKTKIFELKCLKSQKTFQFVAQTPKDMVQWVACINKRTVAIEENHETFPIDQEEEDEEENVYEQLKVNEEPIDTLKKKSKPLPPLPKPAENTYILRHPKPETPPSDQESYDPVCPPYNHKDEHIHDDDDDEQIYDVIQELIVDKSTKSSNNTENLKPINKTIQRPKLDERSRTDSSVTNSFTDDDEEAIYDVLEQKVPDRFTRKPIARRTDYEPEEEYCNLVQNPMTRSPVMQNIDDAEGEYSNIVPNINTAQFQTARKNNSPSTPTITTLSWKVEEPEEEYSNLVAIVNTTNKILTPIPPVVPPPKSPSKLNVLTRNKEEEVNKHINSEQKPQDSKVGDEDVEEEYDCVVSPPKNPPKSNTLTRNKEVNKRMQDSNVDVEEVEEEYDCVVSPPKNSPKSNVQAMIKEANSHIRMKQTSNQIDKTKREPPALKPKPKTYKK